MSRRLLTSVVAVLTLLGGCLDADDAHRPPGGVTVELDDAPGPRSDLRLEAPQISIGTAWTYQTAGYWDTLETLTIVVARADGDGYLFAAAERGMLDDEIAWDLPYFGEMDRTLRPRNAAGGLHEGRLLDFPLAPGKSWRFWGLDVTAQPANVSVLGESRPGYRIHGEDDANALTVEYAESIGGIVRFTDFSKSLGAARWSLELTAVHTSSDWSWVERGDEVIGAAALDPGATPGPVRPPTTLSVSAAETHVFVWALGTPGSTGIVSPPAGSGMPWNFQTEGIPHVRSAWFDGTEGDWSLSGAPGDAEGYVYIQAHALRVFGAGEAS